MATLAKQAIPDYQKEYLESVASSSGESIATIVRDILKREHERSFTVYGEDVDEIINIYKKGIK